MLLHRLSTCINRIVLDSSRLRIGCSLLLNMPMVIRLFCKCFLVCLCLVFSFVRTYCILSLLGVVLVFSFPLTSNAVIFSFSSILQRILFVWLFLGASACRFEKKRKYYSMQINLSINMWMSVDYSLPFPLSLSLFCVPCLEYENSSWSRLTMRR